MEFVTPNLQDIQRKIVAFTRLPVERLDREISPTRLHYGANRWQ
jgi:hypothetical protein